MARRRRQQLAGSWMSTIQNAAYRGERRARGREGRLPAVRRRALPRPPQRRRARCAGARGDPPPRHPQRLPHLDRADRHHLAARRQRVERHRAGVRLSLHAPRAGHGRHGAARRRSRTTPTPSSAASSAPRAALPETFVRAGELSPGRSSRHAGGAAAARRQLHLQDHQLPGGHLLRGVQGRLSRGLRARASRAAPPTGRTR